MAPPPAPSGTAHRRRTLVVTWLLAWVAAGAVGGGAAMAVVELGLFDTTASTPHYPVVGWAAHRAFISSVKRRAGEMGPVSFTPQEVTAGFRQYDHDCVMCHGAPGVPRADFTAGMTPAPPYVIDAARRWTPAQLYWILAEGVKMTAMPAWRASRTDAQVWDDVAFLEALPYISAKQYTALRVRERVLPATSPPRAGAQ